MFYHPVLWENTTICGNADAGCIGMVLHEFAKRNPLFRYECLSGCFQLNYDATISLANIYPKLPLLRKRKLHPNNVAILHVYFKSGSFHAEKRQGKHSRIDHDDHHDSINPFIYSHSHNCVLFFNHL